MILPIKGVFGRGPLGFSDFCFVFFFDSTVSDVIESPESDPETEDVSSSEPEISDKSGASSDLKMTLDKPLFKPNIRPKKLKILTQN